MHTHAISLPLSFRAELLSRVMPLLQAGECCSLIGISGVGKSNLVHFFQRPDVQAHYWNSDQIWVLSIDTHGMVFDDHPVAYVITELMIHRLITEAERQLVPPELVTWASDLHTHLIAQPGAHLAFRYLERICTRLCAMIPCRVIFLFDQFEDIWTTVDARFFLNLRYLRDQLKYTLAYLVITRDRLQQLRPDAQQVEAFWDLFSAHVCNIGMYSEHDAQVMLERLAGRSDSQLEATQQRAVLEWSGCHPGLLRAIFWAMQALPCLPGDVAALLDIPSISEECAKIWNDLTLDEQHLARMIAAGLPTGQLAPVTLVELRLKELVVGNPPMLFAPIFTAYVLRQSGTSRPGVTVNLRLRQVWIDGLLLDKALSRLEFSMLSYLAQHAGTVCKREDILRELYPDDAYDVNDERLDTVLRRLREALNEDARNPRYLITHRGVGVQLTQGQIQA